MLLSRDLDLAAGATRPRFALHAVSLSIPSGLRKRVAYIHLFNSRQPVPPRIPIRLTPHSYGCQKQHELPAVETLEKRHPSGSALLGRGRSCVADEVALPKSAPK